MVDCYTLRDVAEAEAGLAEECSKRGWSFALTGLSGATRLVPAVRYQRAMAYVGGPPEELLDPLQLKVVESGANVSLLVPYDEGVFEGARPIDGLAVVTPVQLYLDLRSFRGRGEEAAQQIPSAGCFSSRLRRSRESAGVCSRKTATVAVGIWTQSQGEVGDGLFPISASAPLQDLPPWVHP